jgi:predicted alpha/beta hydrolase family esterase
MQLLFRCQPHDGLLRSFPREINRKEAAMSEINATPVPVRVLVIPGLNDSGAGHWQTWLESQFDTVRVQQAQWHIAELDDWARAIARTVAAQGPARWVAVAHSFGCLALARAWSQGWLGEGALASALLVAPADPEKFGVAADLPQTRWDVPSVLLGSESDPWMPLARSREWARRWGAQFINLGDVGHVNVASGHGRFPQAKTLLSLLLHRAQQADARGQARAA